MKKKKNKSENVLSRPQVDSVIALYTHGDFEEAIDAIKESKRKISRMSLFFLILLGACYKSLGQLDAALKDV